MKILDVIEAMERSQSRSAVEQGCLIAYLDLKLYKRSYSAKMKDGDFNGSCYGYKLKTFIEKDPHG
jgi:hypothetical protein